MLSNLFSSLFKNENNINNENISKNFKKDFIFGNKIGIVGNYVENTDELIIKNNRKGADAVAQDFKVYSKNDNSYFFIEYENNLDLTERTKRKTINKVNSLLMETKSEYKKTLEAYKTLLLSSDDDFNFNTVYLKSDIQDNYLYSILDGSNLNYYKSNNILTIINMLDAEKDFYAIKDGYIVSNIINNNDIKINKLFLLTKGKDKVYQSDNLLNKTIFLVKEVSHNLDENVIKNNSIIKISFKEIVNLYKKIAENNKNYSFFYKNDYIYNILNNEKIINILENKIATPLSVINNIKKDIIPEGIKNNTSLINLEKINNILSVENLMLYTGNKELFNTLYNKGLIDLERVIQGLSIAFIYNTEFAKYIIEEIIFKNDKKEYLIKKLLSQKYSINNSNIIAIITEIIENEEKQQEILSYLYALLKHNNGNSNINIKDIINIIKNRQEDLSIKMIEDYTENNKDNITEILSYKIDNKDFFLYLIENGLLKITNYLLDNFVEYINKENIDENGNNALLLAVKLGNLDLINKLIGKQFWFDITNNQGENIFTIVCSSNKGNDKKGTLLYFFLQLAEKNDDMYDFLINTLGTPNIWLIIDILIKTNNHDLLKWFLDQKIRNRNINNYIDKEIKQALILITKRVKNNLKKSHDNQSFYQKVQNNEKIMYFLQSTWLNDLKL